MSREDIATLKKYEKELTLKGGEYDGKLFWTGMYAGNGEIFSLLPQEDVGKVIHA